MHTVLTYVMTLLLIYAQGVRVDMLVRETFFTVDSILLNIGLSVLLPSVPVSLLYLCLYGLRSLVIILLSALGIVALPRMLSVSCIIAVTKVWILRNFLCEMGVLPLVLVANFLRRLCSLFVLVL